MSLSDSLAKLEELAKAADRKPSCPDDIMRWAADSFNYSTALNTETILALVRVARCLQRIVDHREPPKFSTSREALAELERAMK